MPFGRSCLGSLFAIAPFVLLDSASPATQPLSLVHRQRYCMGTMFDVVAYHSSRQDAERAIEKAIEEIFRLDQVMSVYKADSELSKVNREAGGGYVTVDPSLYEVVRESMIFSEGSGGKFDVTIAPLLKTWKAATAQ